MAENNEGQRPAGRQDDGGGARHPDAPRPDDQPPTPASSDTTPLHQQALMRLLEDALRNSQEDSRKSRHDMDTLRKVASQHAEREFAFDPVAIRMVEAMVKRVLRVEPNRSTELEQMCRTIARTLWNDESSRERLRSLWHHVTGE